MVYKADTACSKKGRAARRKGKNGERFVANFLKDRGFPARRGVQFSGGMDSPDVICESLPIHWEVKWVEKLNVLKAYAQAKGDAGDKIPAVVHKVNGNSAKVTLDFWDFVDILQVATDKVDKKNNYIDIRDKYVGRGRESTLRMVEDSDLL